MTDQSKKFLISNKTHNFTCNLGMQQKKFKLNEKASAFLFANYTLIVVKL